MPGSAAAAAVTDAYRTRLLILRGRLLAMLTAAWSATVTAEAIDAGVAMWAPSAATLTTRAQLAAAGLSVDYLAGYVGAELDEPPTRVALALAGYAGRTAGGRDLGPVLHSWLPVVIKGRIARGADPGDALAAGLYRANRMTGSLVTDAARDALADAMLADDRVTGWQRVTRPTTCPFCRRLASRGAVYKRDTVTFRSHPHCACTAEPVVRNVPQRFTRPLPATPAVPAAA